MKRQLLFRDLYIIDPAITKDALSSIALRLF